MGGSGAKNRRKLLRQSNKNSDATNNTEMRIAGTTLNSKPSTPHQTADKKSLPEKKKKITHKPKHLKRKLEQAENQDEKQRILHQISTLEQKKLKRQSAIKLDNGKDKRIGVVKDIKSKSFTAKRSIDIDRKPIRTEATLSTTKESVDDTDTFKNFKNKVVTSAPNDSMHTVQSTKFNIKSPEPNVLETTCTVRPVVRSTLISPNTKEKNMNATVGNKNTNISTAPTESLPVPVVEADSDFRGSQSACVDNEKRQRGKRRRGRVSTSQLIQEKTLSSSQPPPESSSYEGNVLDGAQPEQEAKRRCIGRKPVTDFEIGKAYAGTVVYVKPFGVFVDIGCHSDAFCHVSRLSDDYVEKPDEVFQPGSRIEAARIVEIDRMAKRITISLQSEARLQDELASMEARKQRRSKHNQSHPKNDQRLPSKSHEVNVRNGSSRENPLRKECTKTVEEIPDTTPVPVHFNLPDTNAKYKQVPEPNPVDLKRMRKLARRAIRREQLQNTNTNTNKLEEKE